MGNSNSNSKENKNRETYKYHFMDPQKMLNVELTDVPTDLCVSQDGEDYISFDASIHSKNGSLITKLKALRK